MMIFGRQRVVTAAPTIGTDAYTANDVIGGLLTFDISNAGGGGIVRWTRIVDDDNEKAELALYLFNELPSTIADDAAFAPTVADLKKMIGKVLIQAADYETINGNAVAIIGRGVSTDDVNIDAPTNTGKLYGYLVCTATPTYSAATDLTVSLGLWLDG